ncbi:hypothetical protein BT63DRAFT_425385 [Microthyrium microscopicum]|uniref:Zn(2)-C6 fungal-type domain-containing protein n=1 Tax=Microthyrium microscopicum TaxID=703497 RepID=A0A6A6UBR2_9PEZI|nr:hypothetical protein BT63DRAFT_425385 [Microthyrium microscopicum]
MSESSSRRTGSAEFPRAPYGNACMECARSKTKCTLSRTGPKCERCTRLDKSCSPATKGRRRGDVGKGASTALASKTDALEEKLEGVLRILQHSNPSASSALHAKAQPGGHKERPSETPATSESLAGPVGSNSLAGHKRSSKNLHKYPLESEAECEEFLATYRLKMLPFFPAVIIPQNTTAKELSIQRPFLWLVIRAICSKNSARQKALIAEVFQALSNDLVLTCTKSLDLLLGIVVFSGWALFYLYQGPMRLTTVLLLGQGLATELGLLKPVPRGPFGRLLGFSRQQSLTSATGMVESTGTLEERRVVLGLVHLTSIAANVFHRLEPMQWTPYLAESLQKLSEAKEYTTDEFLVYLVRVQQICDKAMSTDVSAVGVPQDVYVQIYQSQIEELKRSIPEHLQSNQILQLHILDAQISIHERSLIPQQQHKQSASAQIQRLESIWACFNATNSWISTMNFCLGPASWPHMSLAIFAQISHCMISLFRLSIFESPEVFWDRQRARQELDLAEVLKMWIANGIKVAESMKMDDNSLSDEENCWTHLVKRLSSVLEWWESKVLPRLIATESRDQASKDASALAAFDVSSLQMAEPLDLTMMNWDFFDDLWMQELMNGGDEPMRDAIY